MNAGTRSHMHAIGILVDSYNISWYTVARVYANVRTQIPLRSSFLSRQTWLHKTGFGLAHPTRLTVMLMYLRELSHEEACSCFIPLLSQ